MVKENIESRTKKLEKLVIDERAKVKALDRFEKLEAELKELKAKTSKLGKITKALGQVSKGIEKEGKEIKSSGFGINPAYLGGDNRTIMPNLKGFKKP